MGAGPVTAAERRRAREFDADVARLQSRGVRASTRLAMRLQRAVLSRFRAGQDPLPLVWLTFQDGIEDLAGGMMMAHLTGREREREQARKAAENRPTLALSAGVYERAVAILRQRLGLSAGELIALEERYQAQAIRVLQTASQAMETRLQRVMLQITEEGLHVREGVRELRQAFALEGVTPTNSFQVEAIYRTQTQMAYSAGRFNADQDPAVQEILWGYKYVTVGDDRVRPEHEGLDGVTLPKDDPFWQQHMPPNGWACRCTVISIFEPVPRVDPPGTVEIDGQLVTPGADEGFRFNPGEAFRDELLVEA